MIWLQLFYVYLKIGIFGFGGGYAMLSLIQADVVDRYGWISSQEFTDIVAISQGRSGSTAPPISDIQPSTMPAIRPRWPYLAPA